MGGLIDTSMIKGIFEVGAAAAHSLHLDLKAGTTACQQRRAGQRPQRDRQLRIRNSRHPLQDISGNIRLKAVKGCHVALECRDPAVGILLERNEIIVLDLTVVNGVIDRFRNQEMCIRDRSYRWCRTPYT